MATANETYDVLLRVKSEGDEQLKQLSRALVTVQQNAKATGTAVKDSAGQMRFGLQNLGFQAQDFAVQVGGGTSALRAFSQQMPQAIDALQNMFGATSKLGAFLGGPWGVALGVAAAVIGPLIAQLVGAGKAADDTAEKLNRFATSADLAKTSGEVLQMTQALGELQNQYRRLAGPSREAQAFFANTVQGKQLQEQIELQQFEIEQTRNIIALRDKQIRQGEAAKDAAEQGKKDAREAAAEARKAAAEQAAEQRKAQAAAEAAARKVSDLVVRFRTSINDVLQANDEALRKYIETINDAADPTIAYAEGLRQLAEAQEKGGVTAEAAALQQQKLADAFETGTLALIKARDQAAGGVGESFDKAMTKLIADNDAAAKETTAAWQAVGDSISDAFGQLVAKTSSVRDVVRSLVADILSQLAKIAIKKFVAKVFTSAAASARGNVFDSKGMIPFASGGVVTQPTIFPFAGGTGLMGEAGPEAIMPLQRDAQGKLGVAAAPVSVNVINNAGAAVTVQETVPGKIEIIIARAVEASRAAIAQDFRRGGSDVARSVERTYGINRAAGAF